MTADITIQRLPASAVRVGDQIILGGLAYPVEFAHAPEGEGIVSIVLGCLPRNLLRIYTKVTLLDVAR